MTTRAEPKQTITFPGFLYRGFDVPGLEMPVDIFGDLGTNQPAYDLAPKSTPLAWRVGLYVVGRDLALEISDTDKLPVPVKEAGSLIYSDAQERKARGGWHKDAVLIEPEATIPGTVKPGADYVAARYFKDIEGFDDKGKIKPHPSTQELVLWLPKGEGRFVVPTMDGAYNPLTGTPFETVENDKEATTRWEKAGLSDKPAKKELSRFYRRDSGVAAVDSWSSDRSGPLCVSLDFGPQGRDPDIGSFHASRSADASEGG